MKRIILISLLPFFLSCQKTDKDQAEDFDLESLQKPVLTHAGIDSVLAQFEQVSYEELDKSYIAYSESDLKFKNSLKKESYYIIRGTDIFKYVVGTYRIKDFLGMDDYYSENMDNLKANKKQYWLVDKKMLYMILDLILMLDEAGYNKYGFRVRESHRHPKLNRLRGGASLSQHVWGRAVDLVIEDINMDGKANQDDKTIVLEFAEKIVGNKGGIGMYPGTMTVHMDSRGKRARWNSY